MDANCQRRWLGFRAFAWQRTNSAKIGDSSDADMAFIGPRSMKMFPLPACFAQFEYCWMGFAKGSTPPTDYCYAPTTPGLPFSTAKVFSVDTLAFGSVTSEMARRRVVICPASTSTLT